MTAAKKITEAEELLEAMQKSSGKKLQDDMNRFISTIHEIFSHLLDEYNKKFGLKIEVIGLEKFKTRAKKAGKIDAINFLIWYEKEYRQIKNDESCGMFLERRDQRDFDLTNVDSLLDSCSKLLSKTRAMTYFAYENF